MGPEQFRSRAWAWYLAAVVFATQYYVVSAYQATPNDTLYLVIGGSAVAAGLTGLVLHRPPRMLAWLAIVGSIGAYLAADAILANLEETNVLVPFPSFADWLYLGIYPVLAVAFVIVRRAIAPGPDRAAVIDSLLVGFGTLGVLGPLYLIDYWNNPFLDTQQQWVAVAYPLGDALLLAAGARLLFAAGRRLNALTLLGASAVAIVIGNAVYNAQALGSGFEDGGIGSVGWLAFTCLLGGAVLHPSVRFAGTSAADAHRPLPSFVRVVAPVVTVAAHLRWGDADSRVLSAVCLVAIVVLGVLRGVSSRRSDADHAPATDTAEQPDAVTV